MSDDEMDREWKPSGRPTSTMAQSFSLALNDIFKMDNNVADLDAVVSEKKRFVSTQTSELEALEARLRATEERLKQAATGSPHRQLSRQSSPRPRAPVADAGDARPRPLATGPRQSVKTFPTGGNMPPTPGPSEGESDSEYVLVEGRPRPSADKREDGDAPQK